MKPAKATVDENVSFALKEQEAGIVLDGVIKRAKESVFTHIRQSTDIVLVTSHNRDGKSAFIAELSKEIDSEIRSLSLHSDDLLNASGKDEPSNDVDFSLISAIIYESINLDEYLLISIDDADKLPIDNFNDLVTLALSTNSKKNNIIFLFAGGPDLLSQVEQISNIRRLSIAHCTLDELMYEDLVEFIDIRQNQVAADYQYNFDDQALKTIVTHASGSLFKAAVLLEWSREFSNFNQNQEISAGTVSQLLSILLNKSQVDGVNLFATYPTPDFDFGASMNEVNDQEPNKKKAAKPKRAKTRKTSSRKSRKKPQNVTIKVVGDKTSEAKPNVYERIMADASEEELISESADNIAPVDAIDNSSEDVQEPLVAGPTPFINVDNGETEIEHLSLDDQQNIEEKIADAAIEELDDDVPNFSATDSTDDEETKPLYIENTDLSLTKLVPKQGKHSATLSSLQWTFIILIIGAILFYGGIMFIASNGNPEGTFTTESTSIEPLTSDIATISDDKQVSAKDTPEVTETTEELPNISIQDNLDPDSPSITDRINSFFASLGSEKAENKEAITNNLTTPELITTTQNKEAGDSQKENSIQALLSLAKLQMENKKLTSPPSDNALDTYRMVLQLDPNNKAATSGVESIRVRYLIWAEQQAMAGNSGQAKIYLERAQELASDSK